MTNKTHKISVAQLDKILALKEKGLALRDIGKLTGLSGEGVRYLINKYAWTRGKENLTNDKIYSKVASPEGIGKK